MSKEEKVRIGVVNWRRAKGVKHHRGETNAGLAQRDYEIPCKTGAAPIIIFEGYHIWWCEPHHQPLAWCEKEKLEQMVHVAANAIIQHYSPRSVKNKSSVSIVKIR